MISVPPNNTFFLFFLLLSIFAFRSVDSTETLPMGVTCTTEIWLSEEVKRGQEVPGEM